MTNNIQKGKLLLSEPALLQDMVFGRSVILVSEYNEQGTIGFIINKPTDYLLMELVPDIDALFPIYNGGPVEQDNLYFIHNRPDLIPYSTEISEGIFWGGDFQIVKEQINKGYLVESNIRFFLGYSGWGIEQLENEIENKSWIIVPNRHKENILSKAQDAFWKEELEALGEEKYIIWSNAPENPEFN